MNYKTTDDIQVPEKIIDQVLGQEEAINIVQKAAKQKRNIILIGEPGTGKSLIGQALSELLPKEKLKDILAFPNETDENVPKIKTMLSGEGSKLITKLKLQAMGSFKNQTFFLIALIIIISLLPYYFWKKGEISDIIYAASMITSMVFIIGFMLFLNLNKRISSKKNIIPKILIDSSKKEKIPFLDATGAHAGALLGDVLHDPLQTFFTKQKLHSFGKNGVEKKQINELVDNKLLKFNSSLIKKGKYEATHLPKDELFVLGEKNSSISPVEALSCNRYKYKGEMIKITTSNNKELIVTPEHKIALLRKGKLVYIQAKDIKESDYVITNSNIIIDEQDIINTYNKRQQNLAKSYYSYLELRKKNPKWGYKRIAKKLEVSCGRTRWWWENNSAPVPIQTVNWLKHQNLIPLSIDNPKLSLITKILGATFGDGGIFGNLNGIFLSSSELEATKEFGKDLVEIFGEEINKNSRTIEAGIEGHSWCYQNTNRKAIRFFQAAGSPIGKKTTQNLLIPTWIFTKIKIADAFFGALFGSDIGIPSIHRNRNQLTSLDLGLVSTEKFKENRINYLETVRKYLSLKSIDTNKITISPIKEKLLFRLGISKKLENVSNFQQKVKLLYCKYKGEKLDKTINEFTKIKEERYNYLINKGYGAEHAMKTLNISPQQLYQILNKT